MKVNKTEEWQKKFAYVREKGLPEIVNRKCKINCEKIEKRHTTTKNIKKMLNHDLE